LLSRSPPPSTLFPYTTLFRSGRVLRAERPVRSDSLPLAGRRPAPRRAGGLRLVGGRGGPGSAPPPPRHPWRPVPPRVGDDDGGQGPPRQFLVLLTSRGLSRRPCRVGRCPEVSCPAPWWSWSWSWWWSSWWWSSWWWSSSGAPGPTSP